MFWVLLGSIGLIIAILLIILGSQSIISLGEILGVCFTIIVISLMCILFPITNGISCYPTLVVKQIYVKAIKSEIDTVRNAQYTNVESGKFIGGALDNIEQSKVLSEYIKDYVYQKADFNKSLKLAELRTQILLYKWFTDGYFISDKIFELEEF